MRLIDADALYARIADIPFTMSLFIDVESCNTARETRDGILDIIKEAPTVDIQMQIYHLLEQQNEETDSHASVRTGSE